jgi:UDP-N-acetylmuramoyl-tripeptide--D-alanyl-D-alanine ligase
VSTGAQVTTFGLLLPGKSRPTTVTIKVPGVHNVINALAAAAVGFSLNLPGGTIAQGLERFRPAAMRSQVLAHQGVYIINDCYNANPASMKAALKVLAEWTPARSRVAILGDMLELGREAQAMHREIGQFAAALPLTHLIVCGDLGREIAAGAREAGMSPDAITHLPDASSAIDLLKKTIRQGDVVLVKASRGMRMEQIVQGLTGMKAVTKQAS